MSSIVTRRINSRSSFLKLSWQIATSWVAENNRNWFYHNLGGWKSKSKVSSRYVSSALGFSFRYLPTTLGILWLAISTLRSLSQSSYGLHTSSLLCLLVSFLTRKAVPGFRVHPSLVCLHIHTAKTLFPNKILGIRIFNDVSFGEKQFNPKHPYERALDYSINYSKQPAINKEWAIESSAFGKAILRSV